MSQIGSFPQVGVNIKNSWNHHLGIPLLDSLPHTIHVWYINGIFTYIYPQKK